jgi:flagellin
MSAINTSLQALQSAVTLDRNQGLLNRSLIALSSGTKQSIVADNPAAAGVAAKLTSQSQRLTSVVTDLQNAVSYTQTGSGILSQIGAVLDRMSEISSLARDPTQNSTDVAAYQTEFQSLQTRLRNTIGGTTAEIGGSSGVASPLGEYDGTQLFGSNSPGYQVVLGAATGESMTIPATNLRAGAMLGLIQQDSSGNFTLDVSSATTADLTAATQQVEAGQATFGAAQARLNLAASAVQTQGQNMASAISQINDVDVASEATQLAKYNVLVQADAAMTAQANTNAEAVLKLLHQ